ncbi:MAG TPA: DUF6265 family protein, partial [Blastocatellia bacterium]
MHRKLSTYLAVILATVFCQSGGALCGIASWRGVVAVQEKPLDVAGLSWLAGDWESKIGEAYVEEHWTAASGGTMIGMGRSVGGGKTRFFEYLRIETRPDGIYYVAHPMGRAGIDFRLTSLTANEAIFENPGHSDHIKRIIYRRDSDNAISGRVE